MWIRVITGLICLRTAKCERKVDGFGDGMRLASQRVQGNIDMFHDVLGEKLLKELAGTSARKGGSGRFSSSVLR